MVLAQAACLALVLGLLSLHPVLADLDVNAVAGVATIGGSPAPAGTVITIRDTSTGHIASTTVDGANIPPFQKGQGRFDTGDVPQFNTGDSVTVSFGAYDIMGQVQKTLVAGTTTVALSGSRNHAPNIANIPAQSGMEDVPWQLDLDPYISDPDTQKSSLVVTVNNPRVTVDGHVLTFLYPEGVTEDTVLVYVKDGLSTATGMIRVTVTPVNDPPALCEIETISIMEGSNTSLGLAILVDDPDNAFGELAWEVGQGDIVSARVDGGELFISSTSSGIGLDTILLSVSDPGGLSDNATLQVEVGANLTALMEHYQSIIEGLNAQICALTEENSALSSDVNLLTTQIGSLEQERADLATRLAELEEISGDSLEELEELRARATLDRALIEELELEKGNLTKLVGELEADLAGALALYEGALDELEEKEDSYRSQIAILEGQLSEITLNLSSLETGADGQESLLANLTQERTRLEALIGQKEAEISVLEGSISNLSSRLSLLQEEKERGEETIQQIEATLASLRKQNQQLLAQIDELANTAPAQEVEPNLNETNMSEPTLAEGLFGRAARLAGGGMRLVGQGMGSTLGIAVIAIIAVVSAVSIAARTSWAGMGGGFPGRTSSTGDLWRSIESRTRSGQVDQSRSLRNLGITGPTSSTAARPAEIRIKESAVQQGKDLVAATGGVIVKREPPSPRRSRATPKKVFVNPRPISIRSQPSLAERESPPERAAPARAPAPSQQARMTEAPRTEPARPPAPPRAEPARPEPARPEPARPEPARPVAEARREAPEDARPAKAGEEPESKKEEIGALSEVDREYIKMLLELGYTKEAEEELRKRSSK